MEAPGLGVDATDPMSWTVCGATVAALDPQDGTETLLAAQAAALHTVAMVAARRTLGAGDETAAAVYGRQLERLTAAFRDHVAAIDRHRRGPQQVVRVERVTVESGGAAIVGAVSSSDSPLPGGGKGSSPKGSVTS